MHKQKRFRKKMEAKRQGPGQVFRGPYPGNGDGVLKAREQANAEVLQGFQPKGVRRKRGVPSKNSAIKKVRLGEGRKIMTRRRMLGLDSYTRHTRGGVRQSGYSKGLGNSDAEGGTGLGLVKAPCAKGICQAMYHRERKAARQKRFSRKFLAPEGG